jgi:hypothetical protein
MHDFVFTFILAGAGRMHPAQNSRGQNHDGRIHSEEIHAN